MNIPNKFIQYDVFKLVIALILVVLILLFWGMNTSSQTGPVTGLTVVPTQQKLTSTAAPQEPASTAVMEGPAEVETPAEDEQPAAAAPLLPPFPVPAENYTFSETDTLLVGLNGEPVYQLSADGSMWVPLIPQELGDPATQPTFVEPDGWQMESNGVSYRWDPAGAVWVSENNPESPAAVEPTIEEPEISQDCAAAPTQLSVGQQARVASNLNLRLSPDISASNRILTMPIGTTVEILAAPVCTPYQNGAYLWWQVVLPDGTQGWAAEASLTQSNYFLTPIE